MPTAYLTIPGLRASVRGERLEIEAPPEVSAVLPERRWIPLFDLEQVVVAREAHLSSRSVGALLKAGIPVVFLNGAHRPEGAAVPYVRSLEALADQLDTARDPAACLPVARALVGSKLRNQRRVLQRMAANRGLTLAELEGWKQWLEGAEGAGDADQLRGYEGLGSAQYFGLLGRFLPEAFPFEGRKRRPPPDPVNALLSLLYTMLGSEMTLALRGCGLEPGWGFFHSAVDGRPALALDLIEPFRAPACDALVIDLLGRGRVQREDFSWEGPACNLDAKARRKVFAAWEDRLEREFFYETGEVRTTLRGLIREQALAAKRYFQRREPWTPFIMN